MYEITNSIMNSKRRDLNSKFTKESYNTEVMFNFILGFA